MNKRKKILLLGATGSIGLQTLDVVRKNREKLEISGLLAHSSKEQIYKSAQEFNVKNVVLTDNFNSDIDTNNAIKNMIYDANVDIVVNALSGSFGLFASYESLKANKMLALANKESLVVGGDLLIPMADNLSQKNDKCMLMPIDSEHGAIFQCLVGEDKNFISKLHITASGGPFFGKSVEDLSHVTPFDALKHPTWDMGKKISIDSATLMNKGLEVIEAHHLFGMPYDDINVVVHPQSIIHSMVEYRDGSIKAHLGVTNMQIPIQYALSYPERWECPVKQIDFSKISGLTFFEPDIDTFKCLALAISAGKIGGLLPCVMNAANEVAVSAFLNKHCSFLDIALIVEHAMNCFQSKNYSNKVESLEQLLSTDLWARNCASRFINNNLTK